MEHLKADVGNPFAKEDLDKLLERIKEVTGQDDWLALPSNAVKSALMDLRPHHLRRLWARGSTGSRVSFLRT